MNAEELQELANQLIAEGHGKREVVVKVSGFTWTPIKNWYETLDDGGVIIGLRVRDK